MFNKSLNDVKNQHEDVNDDSIPELEVDKSVLDGKNGSKNDDKNDGGGDERSAGQGDKSIDAAVVDGFKIKPIVTKDAHDDDEVLTDRAVNFSYIDSIKIEIPSSPSKIQLRQQQQQHNQRHPASKTYLQ